MQVDISGLGEHVGSFRLGDRAELLHCTVEPFHVRTKKIPFEEQGLLKLPGA